MCHHTFVLPVALVVVPVHKSVHSLILKNVRNITIVEKTQKETVVYTGNAGIALVQVLISIRRIE